MRKRTDSEPRPWSVLGRVLPREVRERVYDPALADLTRAWLTEQRTGLRVPFALRAAGTLLACLPIAVPRVFFERGRLTRAGRFLVGSGVVAVILLLVALNLASQYASYSAG